MAPTASRSAPRRATASVALLALLLAALLSACEAPSVIRATPQPTPPVIGTSIVSTPAPSPTIAEIPPESSGLRIERIALSTRIRRDGEPTAETSVVPEDPEQLYLCVRVSGAPLGARFRAFWFANGQIVGQSDAQLTREEPGSWVALGWRPVAALSPTIDYDVELHAEEELIERLAFRVGVGAPEDAVAEAAFAEGFDAAGKPTDPRDTFADDEAQLRLLVRVSNQVDPANLVFTTIWYRGETPVALVAATPFVPDGEDAEPTPTVTGTATPSAPRQLAFVWQPDGPLPRGAYHVSLLLNGTEVRSIPFVVGDAQQARGTATPEPSDTAASVSELVVTQSVDAETNEMTGVSIWVWEGAPTTRETLYAAFRVADLPARDRVQVVLRRDDDVVDTIEVEHARIDDGWLSAELEIQIPRRTGRMFTYTVTVVVNGNDLAERQFEVWAVN